MSSASLAAIIARSFKNFAVLLLPQMDPRQPGDPLGVERVVLAGQLVELLGLVKLAGLHLELGQQVDHPFVGLLGVERRLEDRQRGRRRRRSITSSWALT